MAKRKRKKQRPNEVEILFVCSGCFERAQKKLRQDGVKFRPFIRSLYFPEDIKIVTLESILDSYHCVLMGDNETKKIAQLETGQQTINEVILC